MSKKPYRVRNWKEYNKALVGRGSVTFWVDECVIKGWRSTGGVVGRGRPAYYSDMSIECALMIRAVFKLPLRATEGLLRSVFALMKLALKTPNYTTLCKRQKTLGSVLQTHTSRDEKLQLVIDSTGLKVFGEGEWKVRQHGVEKKRVWRKVHLAVNAKTQAIESCLVTQAGFQDCQGLPLLLTSLRAPIATLIGDGAYDRFSCYEEAVKQGCVGLFPPQHNAATTQERGVNKRKACEAAWKARDEVIKAVRRLGRTGWKIAVGYHRRSLAETAMFRIKTLLGKQLRARVLAHQQIEVACWCRALNKMNTLGMPHNVPG